MKFKHITLVIIAIIFALIISSVFKEINNKRPKGIKLPNGVNLLEEAFDSKELLQINDNYFISNNDIIMIYSDEEDNSYALVSSGNKEEVETHRDRIEDVTVITSLENIKFVIDLNGEYEQIFENPTNKNQLILYGEKSLLLDNGRFYETDFLGDKQEKQMVTGIGNNGTIDTMIEVYHNDNNDIFSKLFFRETITELNTEKFGLLILKSVYLDNIEE